MQSHDSVVIAGSLAQKPRQGGHTWQFLQYILGFKKLGWDVLFIDCLEPSMCRDEAGRPSSLEDSVNLEYLRVVMDRFGLQDDYLLLYDGGRQFIGQPKRAVLDRTRRANFLLNVMGFLREEEILEAARQRVFLDTDPGYGQMWQDLGLADMFGGHDTHVTIAENIGRPDCAIPTCGIDWVTWRQPVVLDEWPLSPPQPSAAITSIGSWRGPYAPIDYKGETYGLRCHEFRRFAALPRFGDGQAFEAALEIHPNDASDIRLLRGNGWRLADPSNVTREPDAYRRYIQGSKAELMIARNMYTRANAGWFSERSTCFLASGRPVLAQDTGVRQIYPSGIGLLFFSSPQEALDGVEAIDADYELHASAAREIAEAYFDSDTVIGELIDKLGSRALAGSTTR